MVDNYTTPDYNYRMLKINRCGIFFIIIFLNYSNLAFCDEDSSLDLEPIIITKSNIHLASPYSLDSDSLKNLPFTSWAEALTFTPLDLQSRTLKAGIQTDFSLRGSTYQGVLVLIDGQRVNDPKLGHYNCDLPLTREDIQMIDLIHVLC